MNGDVIEIRGLVKTFRDFWLRPLAAALKGIDLDVASGDIFGLLGPNGSGKSTTIKLVLGLLRPTAGTIRLFGLPPRDRRARARLGYLPELSYLHPFLTARETVRYYAGLSGLDGKTARVRTDELLERMGLSANANRAVGGFSKGMARKVAFAAALVGHPELLILDEPTSGLDPLATRDVKELIRGLASDGMTILVTSHQLFDMQDVCSRVTILSQGRVVGGGKVADIVAKSSDPRHALEDYFAAAVEHKAEEGA
jgi:ABC-2 type transport system ATP-binding protein